MAISHREFSKIDRFPFFCYYLPFLFFIILLFLLTDLILKQKNVIVVKSGGLKPLPPTQTPCSAGPGLYRLQNSRFSSKIIEHSRIKGAKRRS